MTMALISMMMTIGYEFIDDVVIVAVHINKNVAVIFC
jgi:hypothetical protein